MGRLRFRLQPVLNYRQQLVELRQQELATLVSQVQIQQRILVGIRTGIQVMNGEIEQIQRTSPLDCEQVVRQFACLEQMRVREREANILLQELSGQVEAKRGELAQTMREKQILDKLKERHLARTQSEELAQEGRLLDEISVVRFRNRTQEHEGGS